MSGILDLINKANDIKNIFNQLRIQYQRIGEAMRKIKQNALSYSMLDYKVLLEDNLETIEDTGKKFSSYRENIRERVKELEDKDINIRKLDKEDRKNLLNLKIIESYLSRVIDEHQQILKSHFELKSLYTKELEDLSQMTLIKRFNLRNELYDKILEDSEYLQDIEYFIRPLLNQDVDKTYNINKSAEIQKPIRPRAQDEDEEILEFDDEGWLEERLARQKRKLDLYNSSLGIILAYASYNNGISLRRLKEELAGDYSKLIPNIEIFKEIVIELLRNAQIDIGELKKERQEHIMEDDVLDFQLNRNILDIMDNNPDLSDVKQINTFRINDENPVIFENVNDSTGRQKRIYCSNIYFELL